MGEGHRSGLVSALWEVIPPKLPRPGPDHPINFRQRRFSFEFMPRCTANTISATQAEYQV